VPSPRTASDDELEADTNHTPGTADRAPTTAGPAGAPAPVDPATSPPPPAPGPSGWAMAAAAVVGAAPLLLTVARLAILRPPVWLWGDQALTDIASLNVYRGKMFLGPYSRFGWHHPGPAWFFFLGVFRAVGGGSPVALLAGCLLGTALAAALVVILVWRWLGPRAGWVAAALLAAFQWSFSFDRVAALWNPYAVAVPALLLIVLCARVASARVWWPAFLGTAATASFLVQTDVSTGIVVGALVVAALATRIVAALLSRGGAGGRDEPRPAAGWRQWTWRGVSLAAVLAVFWSLPLYQQATQHPGNMSQLVTFFRTNHSGHHGLDSIRAVDTVWASFPFRLDDAGQVNDANPIVLTRHGIVTHPFFFLYLVAAVVLLVVFARRRSWMRAALAGATAVALLAGTVSAFGAQGPLYPYLVQWMQPFVIPVWLLAVELVADALGRRLARPAGHAPAPRARRAGPRWAIALACAVSLLASVATLHRGPASATTVDFARQAWVAAAPAVRAPTTHVVLVQPGSPDNAPIAEAIADQAMRSGKVVEVPSSYVYLFDPSFAPTGRADLEVIVCCSAAYPLHEPGTTVAGYVNGNIPILVRHLPPSAPGPADSASTGGG